MNRRLALATAVVALLTLTAGCSMIFGGISDEELDREADYDDLTEQDADVVIDIEDAGLLGGTEYRTVYDLNDTEELSLYSSNFYREDALDIHSVRYWYPNGTELTGSEIHVDQGRSSTEIRVPDGNGTLAFSGDAGSRTFTQESFMAGSYQVTLPEDHRSSNYLFGAVSPSGFDREFTDDGREQLSWDETGSTISIRHYLARDIPLFAGLVGIAVVIGGVGVTYYYRQVKRLQERREEMGLDVDTDVDDDSRRPPPGMG